MGDHDHNLAWATFTAAIGLAIAYWRVLPQMQSLAALGVPAWSPRVALPMAAAALALVAWPVVFALNHPYEMSFFRLALQSCLALVLGIVLAWILLTLWAITTAKAPDGAVGRSLAYLERFTAVVPLPLAALAYWLGIYG